MKIEDLYVTNDMTLQYPKYKAQIDMGGFIVNVLHTYTDEQIAHIKDYFGWDVTNFEDK